MTIPYPVRLLALGLAALLGAALLYTGLTVLLSTPLHRWSVGELLAAAAAAVLAVLLARLLSGVLLLAVAAAAERLSGGLSPGWADRVRSTGATILPPTARRLLGAGALAAAMGLGSACSAPQDPAESAGWQAGEHAPSAGWSASEDEAPASESPRDETPAEEPAEEGTSPGVEDIPSRDQGRAVPDPPVPGTEDPEDSTRPDSPETPRDRGDPDPEAGEPEDRDQSDPAPEEPQDPGAPDPAPEESAPAEPEPDDPEDTAHSTEPEDIPTQCGETVTVEAGDSLWRIAARCLPPDTADADVQRLVDRLVQVNRASIGHDPGLIHPGQQLTVTAP